MLLDNVKGIQQRLHELNAEEARLLATIQVSLAGIERIHAQRRMEELTLVELQGKAEGDRHERQDIQPQTKKKKKGKQGKQGQPGNQKRSAEEQPGQPAKRQRQGGPNNAHGGQGGGVSVPVPGPSNPGNWNQRQNQPLQLGGECKCSRVDVHCGGNESCQVCKALGCAGRTQSHYLNNENHGNVPVVASSGTSAVPTWPHVAASVINLDADVMDLQG